jgi:hypothetical protein
MSLSIRLHSIRCVDEINESSASEETYALVTVVRLQPPPFPGVPAIHNLRVIRFGVWEDFDEGETRTGLGRPFWGLNSTPEDILDPANVIVSVSLIENDHGSPDAYRQLVETIATGSLTATLGESDRGVRATRLLLSIRNALDGVDLPIPFILDDDHIGTDLLTLSGSDLIPSWVRERSMTIRSGEGHYTLTFRIARSPFDVFGAIEGKWAQLATGPLGAATGPELPTFDGVGRAQNFQGGIVSWHPSIGANAVWGLIAARWVAIGREQFGYPITDELPTGDRRGRYNHFRAVHLPRRPESTIAWSPETGAHEVYGAIRAKWASLGWTDGSLRYPVSPEQDHPGGRIQRFQGGSLFWNSQNGSVTVV